MYLIPGWVFTIFVFCTIVCCISLGVVLWNEWVAPIFRRKEAREEREAEDASLYTPEAIEEMEEEFPGPWGGEALLQMKGVCFSSLDALMGLRAEYMDSLYERLNSRISAEEREYIENEVFDSRVLFSFLTFAQTHAVDAFLTYVQNDEIFFDAPCVMSKIDKERKSNISMREAFESDRAFFADEIVSERLEGGDEQ